MMVDTPLGGFKETELGLLPTQWEIARLEDVAYARGGYGFPPEYQGETTGVFPFFKVSDMNSSENRQFMRVANNYIGQKALSALRAKVFPSGTVIFPKIGGAVYTNKKRLLIQDSLIDNNVMGVTPLDDRHIISEFLFYYFQTIQLRSIARVGPLPSITAHSVKELLIPLPPLPEQESITEVLSTIQEAIEAQERIIDAARELKRSLMHRLFTCGPYPEECPTKETEIGEIPKHWQVLRLKEISEKPMYGYTESATSEKVGPKFLRITDITDDGVNWAIVPYCRCNNECLGKFRLEAGDILFARTGATTGKSYLIRNCPEAVFASYLIRVRAKEKVMPEFLSAYFQTTQYWNQINRGKSGAAQPGVNAAKLWNLQVPIPPEAEQRVVSDSLTTIDNKIAQGVREKAALEALFRSILHSLMTGEIRAINLEVKL